MPKAFEARRSTAAPEHRRVATRGLTACFAGLAGRVVAVQGITYANAASDPPLGALQLVGLYGFR